MKTPEMTDAELLVLRDAVTAEPEYPAAAWTITYDGEAASRAGAALAEAEGCMIDVWTDDGEHVDGCLRAISPNFRAITVVWGDGGQRMEQDVELSAIQRVHVW